MPKADILVRIFRKSSRSRTCLQCQGNNNSSQNIGKQLFDENRSVFPIHSSIRTFREEKDAQSGHFGRNLSKIFTKMNVSPMPKIEQFESKFWETILCRKANNFSDSHLDSDVLKIDLFQKR